jgi:predicted DNA-binding transcriptional regulator AlpA
VRSLSGTFDRHNSFMDAQTKVIELLREVHLIAFKEIERLNMRIVELENQHRPATENPIPKPAAKRTLSIPPATDQDAVSAKIPELLNEHQVARFVQLSVASVRRWRLYLKIGAAVRYRREDVESWIDSCTRTSP